MLNTYLLNIVNVAYANLYSQDIKQMCVLCTIDGVYLCCNLLHKQLIRENHYAYFVYANKCMNNIQIVFGNIQELSAEMFIIRPCFDIQLSHRVKRRRGL